MYIYYTIVDGIIYIYVQASWESESVNSKTQNWRSEAKLGMELLRVLIIQKGFGSLEQKLAVLGEPAAALEVQVLQVPEPTTEEEIVAGTALLLPLISSWHPHVLVASSRGGKYAAALINSGDWKGPTLLISAMATRTITSQAQVQNYIPHLTLTCLDLHNRI